MVQHSATPELRDGSQRDCKKPPQLAYAPETKMCVTRITGGPNKESRGLHPAPRASPTNSLSIGV